MKQKSLVLVPLLCILVISFVFQLHAIEIIQKEKCIDKPYTVDCEGVRGIVRNLQPVIRFLDNMDDAFKIFNPKEKGYHRGEMTYAQICLIADLFGSEGSLTGIDGRNHRGTCGVAKYLKWLKDKGATNFKFEAKYAYVVDFDKCKKDHPEEIAHVVHVVISYSCNVDGMSIDPGGIILGIHVAGCTWI